MKSLVASLTIVAVLAWISRTASAATLSAVPMQGGMVMPMVSYSAALGRVQVMLDPTVPQLTPLAVSHPGDTFSATDPWFEALDPSRQSLAFSRRYGFVMDTMTEPLPAGTSIWLRKVSGSAGLAAYRYANTAPKAFEPIFGTGGAPSAMAWNGMMFHPTFTAPSGTNSYVATFDAYLADSVTGVEVAGTSSGEFTLTWTSVPDGRPVLSIAHSVVIRWPAVTGNYVLESADSASAGIWTAVGVAPINLEGGPAVVLEAAAAAKVYRLRLMP